MSARHVCLRWRSLASLHPPVSESVTRSPWCRSAFFSSAGALQRQASTNKRDGRDEDLENLFASAVASPAAKRSPERHLLRPTQPSTAARPLNSLTDKVSAHHLEGIAQQTDDGLSSTTSWLEVAELKESVEASSPLREGVRDDHDLNLQAGLAEDLHFPITKYLDSGRSRESSHKRGTSQLEEAMHAALSKKNWQHLEVLWRQWIRPSAYEASSSRDDVQTYGSTAAKVPARGSDDKTYTRFMSYFNRLEQPDRAIEVWNHMVANNLKPNIQHYTAMIQSLGMKQKLQELLEAWSSIDQMGMQRDWNIWASYVNALMRCQGFKQAFRALNRLAEEFAREQAASTAQIPYNRHSENEQSTRPKAVPPSVEILNAALGGAITHPVIPLPRKCQIFDSLVRWASECGLQPNTDTFNIILNMRAQKRDVAELFRTIQQMEESKVPVDEITYNTFVHGLLLLELPAEEQKATIFRFLNLVEGRGLAPDAPLYGKIISGLLKDHNGLAAAEAVMVHMQKRGIVISPQIYSMLLNHHFTLPEPPDVSVVDALWQNVRASEAHYGEHLHDQVIRLYAKSGYVGKAMILLQQMSQSKILPEWYTLVSVVSALVQAGQIDRVREIVYDAEKMRGRHAQGMHYLMSVKQEGRFWEYVESLGLST